MYPLFGRSDEDLGVRFGENHIDIYRDAIFIDGQDVVVVKDSIFVQEPVNGEILSVSIEVVPATLTMHRTEKPKSGSGQDRGKQGQSPVTIDLPQKNAFTRDEVLDLLGNATTQAGGADLTIRHTTH